MLISGVENMREMINNNNADGMNEIDAYHVSSFLCTIFSLPARRAFANTL